MREGSNLRKLTYEKLAPKKSFHEVLSVPWKKWKCRDSDHLKGGELPDLRG